MRRGEIGLENSLKKGDSVRSAINGSDSSPIEAQICQRS